MKKVLIDPDSYKPINPGRLSEMMTDWCKLQNLEYGHDYAWSYRPISLNNLHHIVMEFRFYNDDSNVATMFALKWRR